MSSADVQSVEVETTTRNKTDTGGRDVVSDFIDIGNSALRFA